MGHERRFLRVHATSGHPPELTVAAVRHQAQPHMGRAPRRDRLFYLLTARSCSSCLMGYELRHTIHDLDLLISSS
jgi:hypothetical protein